MDIDICDKNDILSQSIWFNPFIKINGNMCFHRQLCENGIFFINDLISPDNKNCTINKVGQKCFGTDLKVMSKNITYFIVNIYIIENFNIKNIIVERLYSL